MMVSGLHKFHIAPNVVCVAIHRMVFFTMSMVFTIVPVHVEIFLVCVVVYSGGFVCKCMTCDMFVVWKETVERKSINLNVGTNVKANIVAHRVDRPATSLL